MVLSGRQGLGLLGVEEPGLWHGLVLPLGAFWLDGHHASLCARLPYICLCS